MRVPVSSSRMLMRAFAVLMGRRRVGFRLVVLALRMLVGRLMMMVGSGWEK